MREILFRGKRVDNGEWVFGYYIKGYRHCTSPFAPIDYEVHYITYYEKEKKCFVDIEVVPETVGQFTGLTDKNGKKIFEGDIVRNNKHGEDNDTYDYYSTIFSNGSFRAQYLDNLEYTPKIYDIYFEGYEVIGNIHDNPELLQEDMK